MEELYEVGKKTGTATLLDHHRLRGAGAGIYDFYSQAGKGLPFWLSNAAFVRDEIEHFWREEHRKRGYQIVFTPHIGKHELWDTSGHLKRFEKRMYNPMIVHESEKGQESEEAYILRPMNCPFHILIYQALDPRYEQLPVRIAELGTVYRMEKSGDLTGLLRVRGFTQDDAHIFCRKDQVEHEVAEVLTFAIELLRTFGFRTSDFAFKFCKTPKEPLGFDNWYEEWRWAREILENAVQKIHKSPLDLADRPSLFYGVQLDLEINDSNGRPWVCSTIQIDLLMAKKEYFNLSYKNKNGEDVREVPYIIHRTLLGSMERFYAILMEYHNGSLPVWLAPVQTIIIPVAAEKHLDFSCRVRNTLVDAGIRAKVDERNKTLSWKIRDAHESFDKYPYILVIGDQEIEDKQISVRTRSGENLGKRNLSDFIQLVKGVDENKLLTLLPE